MVYIIQGYGWNYTSICYASSEVDKNEFVKTIEQNIEHYGNGMTIECWLGEECLDVFDIPPSTEKEEVTEVVDRFVKWYVEG